MITSYKCQNEKGKVKGTLFDMGSSFSYEAGINGS